MNAMYKNNFRFLASLLFFSTITLCVAGIPTLYTDPFPDTFLSALFFGLFYVSQYFLFAVLINSLLLPVFLFVQSDRLKIIFAFLPLAFIFIFFIFNAKVFEFWRAHINGSVIRMYFSKGGGSQVFEMSSVVVEWIVGIVIVFVLLTALTLWLSYYCKNKIKVKYYLSLFVIIYLAAQASTIYFLQTNNMRYLSYSFKVPYFMDLSWAHYFYPKNSLVLKLKLITGNQSSLHYPLHKLQYHLPQHPQNVLIIVLDSLRYDMINSKNMPFVSAYAKRHDQFLDNISGGDCTRDGIFSLFYSIPATYWKSSLVHHVPSILIQAFQDNHYEMGIYASAPLLSPPFNQNVFESISNLKLMTQGKTAIDRDKKITIEMQNFIEQQSKNHQPFFGFIFYDAPHAYNSQMLTHPFSPAAFLNYFHVSNHTNAKPIVNLYQNAVFEDDKLVGKLLDKLKKLNLNKNTIVIITADHGQEFNDLHNNYWEHASGFSKYQIRTPMILAIPNQKPAVMQYQTTHFDLAPTLLRRVLGVSNAIKDYSVGDDFYSRKQSSFVISGNYAYFALITQNQIMMFHDSGLYRLTDLNMQQNRFADINYLIQSQAMTDMRWYRQAAKQLSDKAAEINPQN